MRYEDASRSGSFQDSSGLDARDDADSLAAGSRGPATGNTITGAGTITGAAGADLAAGATITRIEGAGGSDSSISNGQLQVAGAHGTLSIRADGSYSYSPKPGTPENARDVFTYTLADAAGNSDRATLTIEIGKTQAAVAADAQRVMPGPDGVVVLPAGVDLSDIVVIGRDLVIMLPNGQQMVIVDGAVFVPQLVINDVEVPATNLAALLIDREPQPAAGIPQSSGGNFELPVGPLDPGVPLGDLIPPTELDYTPPEFEEVFDTEDDEPDAGAISVSFDDDDVVEAGNPGGTGDDLGDGAPSSVSGTLPSSGGDGDLDFEILLGTAPTGFAYVAGPGNSVLVQQNGVTVLTIEWNPANGDYTITQNAPIDHAPGDNENNIVFEFSYRVRDEDGDTATGSISINVDDDTPTATVLTTGEPTLAVDETTLAIDASASFAGAFSFQYGADGPGSAGAVYALAVGTGASGLVDTLSGDAVLLTLESGQVVGRAGAGGPIVFTVKVDGEGVVTLDQQRAVVHANPADPNETLTPASTLDNLITLTASVTDGDGDTATGTLGIFGNLSFRDDGPAITVTQAPVPVLVTDDSDTPDAAAGPVSFAGLFTGVFGADGFKDSDDNDLEDPDALSFSLSLKAGNGTDSGLVDVLTGDRILLRVNSAGDVEGYLEGASGTVAFTIDLDPATGAISLDQDRAIAHDDTSDPIESEGSAAVMASDLIVLTGKITDGDGDSASAAIAIGDAFRFEDDGPSITRNQTAAPVLVTDDTDTPNDTAGPVSFAGLFDLSFGKDGFKDADDDDVQDVDALAFSFALKAGDGTDSGLTDVLSGDRILLRVNAQGEVEGYLEGAPATVAFTINLDPATGSVSLEQDRAITHNDSTDPVESGGSAAVMAADLIVINATVTDGDGDTDAASANVGDAFRFEDDGPSISRNQTAAPVLVTDDTDTPGDTAGPVSFAGLFDSSFGKDGPKDADDNNVADADALSFGLALKAGDGTDSGLTDVLSGDRILLRVNGAGDVEGYLEGSPGTVAFTIDLDPATGNVSLIQDRAITHNDPLDAIESGGSAASLASDLVILTATVTDGDGDTDEAQAEIGGAFRFEDDGPSIEANQSRPPILIVDDSDTPNDTAGPVSFAELFTAEFGKDGFKDSDDNDVADADALSFNLTLKNGNGTDSGLTDALTGDRILLRVNAAGDVEGYLEGASDTVAFTVNLDPATGSISLEQDRAITHDDPLDPIESGGSAAVMAADLIVLNGTIVDGDGDTDQAAVNIGDAFRFEDDGPDATLSGEGVGTVTLDETRGENTDTVGGSLPNGLQSATINLSAAFVTGGSIDFGADGPGAANGGVDYALVLSADGIGSGLYAIDPTNVETADDAYGRGAEILLRQEGDMVIGYIGEDTYFTITIDPTTGVATFEQLDNIWHPTGGASYDEAAVLNTAAAGNLQVVQTITDGDGDSDTAAVAIGQGVFQIQDDGPAASDDSDFLIGSTFVATGNVITDAADGDAGDLDTGADDVGEDTPGRIVSIKSESTGATDNSHVDGLMTVLGQYGTLVILPGGDYTYTRSESSPGDVSEDFTYTLSDADGDTVTATLTIRIVDDRPIAGSVTARVDDDGLTGANAAGGNDIDANTGDLNAGQPGDTEAIFKGELTATGGDGDLDFSLVLPAGNATVGQETVSFTLVGNLLTANIASSPDADRVGDPLFTVALDPETGAYTVTLLDNVLHGDDAKNDEDGKDVSVVLPYQVNDADGSTSSANGSLTIQFNDDVPTANDEPARTVVEGGPAIGGNVVTDTESNGGADTLGADGALVTSVTINGVTTAIAAVGTTNVVGPHGSYTFTSAGAWTFTPNSNINNASPVAAGFTYTLTDADGDQSTAVQPITVEDGAGPTGGAITLDLDDQNLSDGSTPGGPDGDSDSITFTPGSDAIASILFSTDLSGLNSDNISWTRIDGDTIEGRDAGTNELVITLQLGVAGNTATVTATLSNNYDAHPALGDDLQNVGSVNVVATDTDGDIANGVVTVRVSDDVPTANDEPSRNVVEGGPAISGNVVTDTEANGGADVLGSDGARVTSVTIDGVTTAIAAVGTTNVAGTYGNYTFTAAGAWTFTPNSNISNASPVNAGFTYTLTDGDGDVDTAVQPITVSDGAGPTGGAITLDLDDQNLADGRTPAGPDGDSDSITFTPGSDNIASILFSTDLSGLNSTNLNWTRVDGDTIVGTDKGSGLPVVTLQLTVVGNVATVEATLNDNYDAHPGLGDDLVNLGSVNLVATDTDGDTADGVVTVRVSDDIPVTFAPQSATVINNNSAPVVRSLDADLTLANNVGADGGFARFPSSLDGTSSGMTSGGVPIIYDVSANGLTLTALAGAATVFTVTLSGNNYTIDMNATIDSVTNIEFTDANFDFIGGNKAWFGIVPNGEVDAPVNNNSQDVLITPIGGPSVNTSGILGGIDTGQSVGPSEGFRLDYVVDLTGSPPNNYTQNEGVGTNAHQFDTHWNTNGASVSFRQSNGTTLRFQAFDDVDSDTVVGDGTLDTITGVVITYNGVASTQLAPTSTPQTVTLSGRTFSYYLDADGKSLIVTNVGGATGNSGPPETTVAIFTSNAGANPGYTSLEVEYVSGDDIKFSGFGAAVQNSTPVSFNLPVELVDGDGDVVAGSPIAITANPAVAPVTLDLDGDGQVSYLALSAGVAYDYSGAGLAEHTAWVAANDGILVRDANGDGTVTDASEFVFGSGGLTDLQALRLQYGDVLNAADADFVKFGIWQDGDSDGVADAGEVASLGDLGIVSLSLVGDGTVAAAAGGDVQIAGTAGYTRADGTTGVLHDALFLTGGQAQSQKLEQQAANSNTAVLAAVAAAAGLAAAPTAAQVTTPASQAAANAIEAIDSDPTFGHLVTAEIESGNSLFDAPGTTAAIDTRPAAGSMGDAVSEGSAGNGSVDASADQAGRELSALLGGTDNPAGAPPAPAAEIIMPSSEALDALVAAASEGRSNALEGKHDAVIESLVAEVLNGGGAEPDIDALLEAIGQPSAEAAGLAEQLASGGAAFVPGWDSGHFASLPVQPAFSMEATALHHDTVQAA